MQRAAPRRTGGQGVPLRVVRVGLALPRISHQREAAGPVRQKGGLLIGVPFNTPDPNGNAPRIETR